MNAHQLRHESSIDLGRLGEALAADGLTPWEDQLRTIASVARTFGQGSPALDVLVDDQAPEVARYRAYLLVASRLMNVEPSRLDVSSSAFGRRVAVADREVEGGAERVDPGLVPEFVGVEAVGCCTSSPRRQMSRNVGHPHAVFGGQATDVGVEATSHEAAAVR